MEVRLCFLRISAGLQMWTVSFPRVSADQCQCRVKTPGFHPQGKGSFLRPGGDWGCDSSLPRPQEQMSSLVSHRVPSMVWELEWPLLLQLQPLLLHVRGGSRVWMICLLRPCICAGPACTRTAQRPSEVSCPPSVFLMRESRLSWI